MSSPGLIASTSESKANVTYTPHMVAALLETPLWFSWRSVSKVNEQGTKGNIVGEIDIEIQYCYTTMRKTTTREL